MATVTTGTIGEGRNQWTYTVTVKFAQIPDDRRDAYWAALKWIAEEVLKEYSRQRAAAVAADEPEDVS